ncbi:40S ribosomal protein SA [Plecturocebus cupreus]
MCGTISHEHPWEVMPDLYFYRDPEGLDKEEQATVEKAVSKEDFRGEWTAPAPAFTAPPPEGTDWSDHTPTCQAFGQRAGVEAAAAFCAYPAVPY